MANAQSAVLPNELAPKSRAESDLALLSERQLLELMNQATDELIRRTQETQILHSHLLATSRGNTNAMLHLLQETEEQFRVEKCRIREGGLQKLYKKASNLFSEAVSKTKEQITFMRIFNAVVIYQFGLTPYLIQGVASGQSLLGIVYGTAAIGLTSPFLYPDILRPTYIVIASVLTNELSYFLKDGIFHSGISTCGSFLSKSLVYIGWPAIPLDFAVSKGLVYSIRKKIELFSYVWGALKYGFETLQSTKDWWYGKGKVVDDFELLTTEDLEPGESPKCGRVSEFRQ